MVKKLITGIGIGLAATFGFTGVEKLEGQNNSTINTNAATQADLEACYKKIIAWELDGIENMKGYGALAAYAKTKDLVLHANSPVQYLFNEQANAATIIATALAQQQAKAAPIATFANPGGGPGGGMGNTLSAEELKQQQFDDLVSKKYELAMLENALKPEFQSRVKTNAAETRKAEDKAQRRRAFNNGLFATLLGAGGDLMGGTAGEMLEQTARDVLTRSTQKEDQRNQVDIYGEMGDLQNAISNGTFNKEDAQGRIILLRTEISNHIAGNRITAPEQLKATQTAQVLVDKALAFMTSTPKERAKAEKKANATEEKADPKTSPKETETQKATEEKRDLKIFFEKTFQAAPDSLFDGDHNNQKEYKKVLKDFQKFMDDHPKVKEALLKSFEEENPTKGTTDQNLLNHANEIYQSEGLYESFLDSIVSVNQGTGKSGSAIANVDKDGLLNMLDKLGVKDKADEIALAERTPEQLQWLLNETIKETSKEVIGNHTLAAVGSKAKTQGAVISA